MADGSRGGGSSAGGGGGTVRKMTAISGASDRRLILTTRQTKAEKERAERRKRLSEKSIYKKTTGSFKKQGITARKKPNRNEAVSDSAAIRIKQQDAVNRIKQLMRGELRTYGGKVIKK